MLVAAGGVAGEFSNCRRNVAFPLGSAGVSDRPDSYPKMHSKQERNATKKCTYGHRRAHFGA